MATKPLSIQEQETRKQTSTMEQREKTCILDLGDDLIAEIFIRLPLRSILRTDAVCKDFRRVAHARRRPLEILHYSADPAAAAERHGLPAACRADDYDYLDALSVSARCPGGPPRRRLARLPASKLHAERLGEEYCLPLASCDDLLLLGTANAGQYLVCNPATWQWAELPRLRRCHDGDGELLPSYAFRESGFYFHEPSDEYRLLCHVTIDEVSRAAYYYVLSTGANEPRRLDKVETTPIQNMAVPSACAMITPAVYRGRLHWLQHPEAGSAGEMAVFDSADETFSRMPSPPTNELFTNLLVADGSLMASEFGKLGVDLWVLEGYNGGGAGEEEIRWQRRHRVAVPWQASMPTCPLVVAGGDRDGEVVLGSSYGVVVYDVKSATVRIVDVGPGGSKDVLLTRRALRLRESFVRHGFFETRPHPGLSSFRLYQCIK